MKTIDQGSNTVTLPPQAMREAMNVAVLGEDVYGATFSCAGSIYKIRRATVVDAPTIAHHRASMFQDMRAIAGEDAAALEVASLDYLSKAMDSGEYLAWLIESSDRVVAGGGMIIRQLLPRPGYLNGDQEAHILNMYTEQSQRRRGLARVIMTAMLDWCAKQGIKRISLHASNEGRPLYEKLGFKQTNEMRFEPMD